MLFGLSGVAYFIQRRRVRNVQPVTFELYAEWNETWHVLRSIYVEKTQIIVFKITGQFC